MSEPQSERLRNLYRRADEASDRVMREIEESGELNHLHGKPLDLDDDPDWLVTRVLKQQGFSHPMIEMGKDLEELREKAVVIVERLHRRRRVLASKHRLETEAAERFNQDRETELEKYREALVALNRAVRDHNLQVPEALHHRPPQIEAEVARVSREIEPLTVRGEPEAGHRPRSLRQRLGLGPKD